MKFDVIVEIEELLKDCLAAGLAVAGAAHHLYKRQE